MLVRALIVLLLVLNLGVAAWWIAHDPPPPPAPIQTPAGVMRLQLVGEGAKAPVTSVLAATSAAPASGAAASGADATAATTPATPADAANDFFAVPVTQHCFGFGPFASKAAADAATTKLRPLVQKLKAHEQGTIAAAATRGWRVFLPPQPSLEEAQATAQRITAAGFTDLIVVREGAGANSIALGRYRNEEGARSRVQALTAAGFPAQLEALDAPGAAETTTIWLEVVTDEAFDPRKAQASIAAAQHRKLDCAALR
ncbi:hypothetical protein [Lysobacter fragariae]